MRNEVKGAVAAGAGVLLLLGGGGTFAVWNDSKPINGGTINSGHLALATTGANTGCGAWQLDSGEQAPLTYTAGDKLVPGDVLTRECKFTIEALGNHLRATVGISAAHFTNGDFGGKLVADVSGIKVNGNAATSFTEENNGQTLTATVTVTFNGDSGNGTQDLATTLSTMTLTATQVHA